MQPASLPPQPAQSMGQPGPGAGQAAETEGVIEPEADAALRRMSAHLGGLQSFRVAMTTTDEHVTKEGQKIQFVKETEVAVRRPDKMLAERYGPKGHVIFRYDGAKVSVHSPELGVYAIESAPADLKSMIDFAHDRLHIEAPAGDLLMPDTYNELIEGLQVGRYIGRERIDGVLAHHLAISEKEIDWQIWIKDGPDAVPLRFVITTKSMREQPQFTAELRNWRPNVALGDEQFAFTPPANAKRMTFDELQKMKQAMKREVTGARNMRSKRRKTGWLLLAVFELLAFAELKLDAGVFVSPAHAVIGRPLTPVSYAG
ncbi:MAG: DUF2092 domain-containing protein, partial [Solimonas sp.]